jgi:hypothetical protein
MAVLLNAVAVTHAPNLDQQAITNFRVSLSLTIPQSGTPTFHKPEIGHEPSAIVFVTEIWPNDIVENMGLERMDRVWQPGQFLWPRSRRACRVNDKCRDVVKMGVGYQIGVDERAGNVLGICVRVMERQAETRKWA